MDDVGKRRRANWRSCVETERYAGLEVARKWAKEDDKYRALLLRIAKAVEEARREIDVQTLQHLIDPEHRMDAGDWVRFWKDRGFSGASEPSDVSDRAFADAADKLFQKVRTQL
jgi:Zn-dependent oligopeptidase